LNDEALVVLFDDGVYIKNDRSHSTWYLQLLPSPPPNALFLRVVTFYGFHVIHHW